MKALAIRTKMIGGGTSYDVYIPVEQKNYRPITAGVYATIIIRDWKEYYHVSDFIRTPEIDSLPAYSTKRWDVFKAIEKQAEEIKIKIASKAFPELNGLGKLPLLWASWTMESKEVEVEF